MALAEEVTGVDEGSPDESWLNRDIADWAAARGIDLNGATRKDDMLYMIEEAQSDGDDA